jgi:hypothetical protein
MTGPRTPPETRLPLAENLRIYLYQLADAGHLSRDQADALLAGEVLLDELPDLPAGPAHFVRDCLARLFT